MPRARPSNPTPTFTHPRTTVATWRACSPNAPFVLRTSVRQSWRRPRSTCGGRWKRCSGVPERLRIDLSVNGRGYNCEVEPRLLLSDFLRHELRLTGTH